MWPLLAQHEAENGGLQKTIDTLARTPLSEIVIFVGICTVLRMSLFKYLRNTVPHRRHGVYSMAKFTNEAMDAIIYAGVFVFMLIRPFAVQAFLIPSGSMLQTLWLNDFIVANKAIYRYTDPKFQDIVVFKPPRQALNADQGDLDFIKRCIGTPGSVVEVRGGKLFRDGVPIDENYLSDSPARDTDANGHAEAIGKDVKIAYDWKLVQYNGKARPELDGQYIPVQIRRETDGRPRYNYDTMTCHLYAAGAIASDSGQSAVSPNEWKPTTEFNDKDWAYERELEAAKPAAVPGGFVLMMGDNRNNSYDGRAWGLVPRDDVIGRSEFIWLPVGRWRVTR